MANNNNINKNRNPILVPQRKRCLCVASFVVTMVFSISLSRTQAFVLQSQKSTTRRLASPLYQVATTFLSQSEGPNTPRTVASTASNGPPSPKNNTNKEPKQKLSRPERKALERAKKERKRLVEEHKKTQRKNKDLTLHSTAVSKLTQDSTADDVVRAIKRAQNMHDNHDLRIIAKFLLDECDDTYAYGYRGSLLARLAVAALHVGNNDCAARAIQMRRLEHRSSMLPLESSAIIRGLLRIHNVTDAFEVLNDELSLPMEGTDLTSAENKERIKHRAGALASIASRHFFENEPLMAVKACGMLAKLGPVVRQSTLTNEELDMPWARIIDGAAKYESGRRSGKFKPSDKVEEQLPCNLVYSVLNAMATFPSNNNDRVYESLSNSLVRRVLFITGAVSMKGCPPPDRGEAAFIGRSNVGKSSLVNMITNRKSLAYTSKRPGKTQQFNFFAVNDKPDREKEIKYGDVVRGKKDLDSFYIVDLPGFGFAKVPEKQRRQWAEFLDEYLANRSNLKVVFHLIDGRHGPIAEDMNIMKKVGESLPRNVAYVVVLTKADKNVKSASKSNPGKVSTDVMAALRDTMKQNDVGKAPIILTSAETKLGRDDIWRYLKLAAEYK